MRKIVYYVATSLDGFISAPDEDISGFVGTGTGIEKYLADLADFDTVIMGRRTYEFGYRFGLKPGQPAYPHMTHYIFSNTLRFDNFDPRVQVKKLDIQEIDVIRSQEGSDIYLCGGGQFAGWLLDHKKIETLKLKLNPLILGHGVKVFGSSKRAYKTELVDTELYENGLQIMTFDIKY